MACCLQETCGCRGAEPASGCLHPLLYLSLPSLKSAYMLNRVASVCDLLTTSVACTTVVHMCVGGHCCARLASVLPTASPLSCIAGPRWPLVLLYHLLCHGLLVWVPDLEGVPHGMLAVTGTVQIVIVCHLQELLFRQPSGCAESARCFMVAAVAVF